MGDGGGTQLHVAVLPWLAFGHLLPFFQLSKSLARRGHRVSFLSTPRNLQRLPPVPPSISHLVTLVELPFPRPAGHTRLPAGAEATSDIRPADNAHLKAAFDALEAPVAAFLDAAAPPPDWVVHDFAAHWMPRVAAVRGLPCAFLCLFPPWALAFFGPPAELIGSTSRLRKRPEDFTVPPPWIASVREASALAYRLHEAQGFFPHYDEQTSTGVSDSQRAGLTLESVHLVLLRTCPEVDGDWLHLLGELYGGKPVLPTGFLPPPAAEEAHTTPVDVTSAGADVFEWLDRQAPSSVLYVALGSEAVIAVDLFHELALGVALSRTPFLWALRRPAGLPPEADLLPEDFEARTTKQGIVAKGWVPQQEILAHPAVGGFLTHCGWSSLVEGLRHGRPLVMLPVFVDQGLNARMMAARGCGVEVPRREEDGAFTGEGVAAVARLVIVDEAGEEVRAAARRAGRVFGDHVLQERYEDQLALHLVENRRPGVRTP